MEITINAKQMLAFIWTMIAVALSLIIVLAPVSPLKVVRDATDLTFFFGSSPWQMALLLFFVSVLVLTLPVYLLLALWHILSEKSETD